MALQSVKKFTRTYLAGDDRLEVLNMRLGLIGLSREPNAP